MENSRPTQCQRVLDYMEQHGGITQFEAMIDLGVMRLASRISELKKEGYEIQSKIIAVKNRYGEPCYVKEYRIGKEDEHGHKTDRGHIVLD